MAGMTVGKIVVESDPTLTKISEQLAELIAALKAGQSITINTAPTMPRPEQTAHMRAGF